MTDLRPMILTSAERVQAVCTLMAADPNAWRTDPDTVLQYVETVRMIEQAVLYDLKRPDWPITEEIVP